MKKTLLAACFCLCGLTITNNLLAQEPPNLSAIKASLAQYYDSGEYFKSIQNTASDIRQYLALRVTENNMAKNPKHLAIVLDIDETVLSNVPFLKARHFCCGPQQLDQYQAEEKLEAIEPMKAIYQFARQSDIAVFFVTARPDKLKVATAENLKKAGFEGWSGLYCRGTDKHHKAFPSIMAYKQTARQEITEQGFTIVATIGDQTSDIEGKYAEKGFKLSNPFYQIQ